MLPDNQIPYQYRRSAPGRRPAVSWRLLTFAAAMIIGGLVWGAWEIIQFIRYN